jgi:YidC/Oxa1 family membrane protein insertase
MIEFLKVILLKPLFNALILIALIMPGQSLGWAIIILTIIIRLILVPSTNSATKAQKKMKKLQPKLQKIKEQYKDDKAAQGQKTLELYRKYKINPLGSCLPILIQLPILYILFYIFRIIGQQGHRFDLLYAWVPQPEHLNMIFLGIDLSQPDVWVLPITAGALQFISAWQMKPQDDKKKEPDFATTLTRQMLFLFPLMTIWFARMFPAALPLYWATSTAFLIIQQQIILRKKNGEPMVADRESLDQGDEKVEEERYRSKRGIELTVRKKTR